MVRAKIVSGSRSGLLLDPTLRCATCGTPLGDDPEDEPDGDAGLPICGECNRARNFDLDPIRRGRRVSVDGQRPAQR